MKFRPHSVQQFMTVCGAMVVLFGSATAADVHLGGYLKHFFVDREFPSIPVTGAGTISAAPSAVVSNRLRLNARGHFGERLSVHVSYDLTPVVSHRTRVTSFFSSELDELLRPSSYRIDDLHRQLYPSLNDPVGNFVIEQNLDRAFVSISTEPADIIIGRQPIAVGSARVVNPTDVLAPFAFSRLDTEDRIGVDAIRIRKPLGFMGELDLGYLPGEDIMLKNSACYLRGRYYLARTDVAGMVLGFQDNLMVGFDLARAIGGAGTWLEAAYVWIDELADVPDSDEEYGRISVGADYSFSDEVYGFIEYHFNGAGADDPGDYYRHVSEAFSEATVYLASRHYLTPGVQYEFTPLIIGFAEFLTNLFDGSLYAAPSLEYNIAQDIYLSGGAFIGIGDGFDESAPYDPPLDLQTEFGGYPDIFYTSFRVYF